MKGVVQISQFVLDVPKDIQVYYVKGLVKCNGVLVTDYENSCLLRCDALLLGEWYATFRRNLYCQGLRSLDPLVLLNPKTLCDYDNVLWTELCSQYDGIIA